MKILSISELDIQPEFDFSTFLFLAQVDEIGPQEMLSVLNTWEKWRPNLKVYQLGERKGHVLVYLEKKVEDEVDEIPDPFMRRGLMLAVDGTNPSTLRAMLEAESLSREELDEAPARVYEAAGGYAPTIGILGAVLG